MSPVVWLFLMRNAVVLDTPPRLAVFRMLYPVLRRSSAQLCRCRSIWALAVLRLCASDWALMHGGMVTRRVVNGAFKRVLEYASWTHVPEKPQICAGKERRNATQAGLKIEGVPKFPVFHNTAVRRIPFPSAYCGTLSVIQRIAYCA